MSQRDNKKYYFLKIQKTFFKDISVKYMRRLPGGELMTIIYLELLLESLENDGKIIFNHFAETFSEEIAILIDEEVENVKLTLTFLAKKNMVIFGTEDLEFLEIDSFIGSETQGAKRKRLERKKQSNANISEGGQTGTNSGNFPPEYRVKSLEIRDKSIDNKNIVEQDSTVSVKEAEFSEESDTKTSKEADKSEELVKEVLDYLNKKTNKNFKNKSTKNKTLIHARSKEGYKLEDFKKVIDNKTPQWIDDPANNKFLRPETLFGTKFEGYLNEKIIKNKPFKNNNNKTKIAYERPQVKEVLSDEAIKEMRERINKNFED